MSADAQETLRRRNYRNPPVVEAIARVQWAEPAPWNLTTPGRIFEQLRDLYPDEPRSQNLVQASLPDPGAGLTGANFQLLAGPNKIVFSREDGSRLIAVSPSDLSVHGLQPYEGWESVEARLYEAVARVHPVLFPVEPAVALVGLRYVNRIEIPAKPIRFEDYLTITIRFPDTFPAQIGGFLDQTEMSYPDEPVKLRFTWGSVDASEGTSAFVLDLDYYYEPTQPISLEESRTRLDEVKARERFAFESLLQDRLREQFDEVV